MVRIAVGIITYQDKPGLIRLFKSIYEYVDVIIIIDGRYPDWGTDDMPKFSTDGTKEMCDSLSKVKLHFLYGPQIEKRSKYLELCKEYDCDFLIVLDADDFVLPESDWKQFRQYLDEHVSLFEEFHNYHPPRQIYNIHFILDPGAEQERKNGQLERRPVSLGRVIYKPYELYHFDHWRIKNKKTDIISPYPRNRSYNFLPGLIVTSDDLTRPLVRHANDIDYQWDLFLKEGYKTKQEHDDPKEKQKFIDSILNEVIVWKKYYNDYKDSNREVDEDWLDYINQVENNK